jgi:ABC-type branched-subunit amino acid transport system substrate-binding protein
MLCAATMVIRVHGKDLNIGLFMPVTGWNTSDVRECVFAAVMDINAQVSKLPGHSLKIVHADLDPGCSSAKAGKAAVQLLNTHSADDEPLVLIGPGCSSSTVATVSLFQAYDLPVVSPSATHASFSNSKTYPSFLRTASPDGHMVSALVMFMKRYGFSQRHGLF